MKKLVFIALMLSFLAGNAQQDNQLSWPGSNKSQDQSYTEYNPGYPYAIDLNRYSIRKPDNTGIPIYMDQDTYSIMKPDDLGQPYEINVNRYSIKKPDESRHPVLFQVDRYRMKKTD
jgi:hypothetical protein